MDSESLSLGKPLAYFERSITKIENVDVPVFRLPITESVVEVSQQPIVRRSANQRAFRGV